MTLCSMEGRGGEGRAYKRGALTCDFTVSNLSLFFITRPVGFDIAKGEKVLSSGDILGAAELGLLASVGVTKVNRRSPRSDLDRGRN